MPDPPCPPPPSARETLTQTFSWINPTVPPVVPDAGCILSLPDLVDLGLQNSPTTRAAWYQAKEAATDVGTARGAYLPILDLNGVWEKVQYTNAPFNVPQINHQKDLKVTLSGAYLLFDFGGRNGNLMAAKSALESLNWLYNWEVQTVMINVIQSYYNYVNAAEIVEADENTVRDNCLTFEIASALARSGINNLADELQAQTALLQAQIQLEQDKGILQIAYATLIQALGLPPETCLTIAPLPEEIETDIVCQNMTTLLQIAKENRADLLAQRANVLERRFKIRTARSALLPSLHSFACGSYDSLDGMRYMSTYDLKFDLRVPLFHQFRDINFLRKEQAALLEAQAVLDNDELAAYLAVLSDYHELVANTQILKYSYSYVESAKKSREVAFANYKMGITSILDLMTANFSLNAARLQLADAKTNFLSSIANLSYDTGGLTVEDFFDFFARMGRCDEACH